MKRRAATGHESSSVTSMRSSYLTPSRGYILQTSGMSSVSPFASNWQRWSEFMKGQRPIIFLMTVSPRKLVRKYRRCLPRRPGISLKFFSVFSSTGICQPLQQLWGHFSAAQTNPFTIESALVSTVDPTEDFTEDIPSSLRHFPYR